MLTCDDDDVAHFGDNFLMEASPAREEVARISDNFLMEDPIRTSRKVKTEEVRRAYAQEMYNSLVTQSPARHSLVLHDWAREGGKSMQHPTCVVLDGTAECVATGNKLLVRDAFTGARRPSIKCLQGRTILCLSEGYPEEAIFTGESDGAIRKYNVLKGKLVHSYVGHTKMVTCLRYHPDERTMFSASADGTIRKWNLRTGECVRTMSGHSMMVTCMDLCTKRNFVFSGSGDTTVKKWNARSGRLLGTIVHKMPVATLKVNEEMGVLRTTEWGGYNIKHFRLDTCDEKDMGDAIIEESHCALFVL